MLCKGFTFGHRVRVDYAEDPVRRLDRHAQDRMNVLGNYALRVAIALVNKGIGFEDRRSFLEAFGNDRFAESRPFMLLRGIPLAPCHCFESVCRAILNKQYPAIRIDHFKDGAQDAIIEIVKISSAADEIAHAINCRQIALHAAVVLNALELRRQTHQVGIFDKDPLLQVTAGQVGNRGDEICMVVAAIRLAAEFKFDAAESNAIAGMQFAAFDSLAVYPCSVATFQIGDEKYFPHFLETTMPSRKPLVEYLNIGVGAAANDKFLSVTELE